MQKFGVPTYNFIQYQENHDFSELSAPYQG